MPHELFKQYEPAKIEERWAEYWLQERLFECPTPAGGTPVFCLLLPPPNVTGRLHIGHMLNQTEMDITVRWRRMRGFTTLWLPGTDHASIATHMMVERQLAAEGTSRQALGREKFLERAWQWRQHYGGAILAQMKRLGASVDWNREYFTMDERLSAAVKECFVSLWEEGLIYRGTYMVNWCPRCGTAISDLEVVHEETNAKLYQVRYPIVGREGEFITVATTRPETMLGDVAIAVNEKDARYANLRGARALLPLAPEARSALDGRTVGREIPIIFDELANPEFGTGAVKVTPAHDPNDYAAGKRHNLPQVEVIDGAARMTANAGTYAGLDRFAAREQVLRDLEAQGFLAGTKDHVYSIGKCDRCKSVVEPRISTQWFVAVNKPPKAGGATIAERAIEVVENGEITFAPENYRTIYLNWMRNIYDWCISRQLWWGHRIPAWHCTRCNDITVTREERPPACAKCGASELTQDPDVLDTWFSSALVPFTAFGWPRSDEQTKRDLAVFYPSSLLITGFDILFFWVARMVMMGCHFMRGHRQDTGTKKLSGYESRRDDSVPFRDVYIHALVRDADRQKMSKTKGNVIDPIEITNQFGTDAVRFTLASMAAPGTDIAYNEKRTEGYRAFANKIWNAARFLFMNVDRAEQAGVFSLREMWNSGPTGELSAGQFASSTSLEDRWIASRFHHVARELNLALAGYRFDEAAQQLYQFFWNEFCDWYLELLKLRFNFEDAQSSGSAGVALRNGIVLFEAALRLLGPFMPFITEELWQAFYEGKPPCRSIALAPFPLGDERQLAPEAELEMAAVQELITAIRNLRAELKVEPREKAAVRIFAQPLVAKTFRENGEAISRLAMAERLEFSAQPLAAGPGAAAVRSTPRFDVQLLYEKKIDVAAERERLTRDLAKYEQELRRAQAQLSNEGFLAKAPAKVVEGLRTRASELQSLTEKTNNALKALG